MTMGMNSQIFTLSNPFIPSWPQTTFGRLQEPEFSIIKFNMIILSKKLKKSVSLEHFLLKFTTV